MQATVYKSTGSWYLVKTATDETYQARMKGIFKKDGNITSTNPVAVGDVVEIMLENSEDTSKYAIIADIGPRKNYIVRSSPRGKHKKNIVAVNMDQALLVCTVKEPRTSQGFIDRFLVTAAAYHIPVMLVFNKKDIFREKEMERFELLKELYSNIGYPVLLTSTVSGEGVDEMKTLLKDKVTLMSGHSGVGKSSLLNVLMPGLELKTQAVSGWSGKGLHTTTFAEMYDLPFGGSLIDTPGVREFGIVDIPKTELSHYFLDMQSYITQCQFNNCLHIDEPGCAVKAAVESGRINIDRYISYTTILDSIETKAY